MSCIYYLYQQNKKYFKTIASRLQNVCLFVVEFCVTKSFYFRLKTKKKSKNTKQMDKNNS